MEKFSLYEKNNILQVICEYLKTTNIQTPYFESYFEFLKYFQNLEKIDKHSMIIGVHFVYGWMPRIPRFQYISEALDILNYVKKGKDIKCEDYFVLIKSIDNSIVGVSKLLHFINPNQYPIFDGRIKSFFKTNKLSKDIYCPTQGKKDKEIMQYLTYKTLCEEIIEMELFQKIFDAVSNAYPITANFTKMRMLENLFFSFDKNSN